MLALPASCDLEKARLGRSTPQAMQGYVVHVDKQGGHLISAPLANCDFEKADLGRSMRHSAQVCTRCPPTTGFHSLAFGLRRTGDDAWSAGPSAGPANIHENVFPVEEGFVNSFVPRVDLDFRRLVMRFARGLVPPPTQKVVKKLSPASAAPRARVVARVAQAQNIDVKQKAGRRGRVATQGLNQALDLT